MIDTGKMLESVERLERVFGGETRATQSIGEVKELLVNLRQAEKDAARYRCIKSIARVIECEEFDMDMLDSQDLDAMVDECIDAMQCK